jgi:hypothetical protein
MTKDKGGGCQLQAARVTYMRVLRGGGEWGEAKAWMMSPPPNHFGFGSEPELGSDLATFI